MGDDLGQEMSVTVEEDQYADATDAERDALLDTEVELDVFTQKFVDGLVDKLIVVTNEFTGHPFRQYQLPFARRIYESLIINDGDTLTSLWARQSGKTETIANCIATAMVFLPRLAKVYPELLDKYREGVLVGAFAPTDTQAAIIHGRIVARLTSEHAASFLQDPEINERVTGRGRQIKLVNCGSELMKNTCHPRAKIEGQTFHIILIDETQDADTRTVDKSVVPMGTSTNATKIFIGTPTYVKNIFYREIQTNKRSQLRRGKRQNHFEVPWWVAAKESDNYRKAVKKAMLTMGEDSDEFRLSYKIEWLLDKGQFVTSATLEELGDTKMQYVVHNWHKTPVVAGIDCARIVDRTIVTVMFVDWNNPDEAGYVHHRILKWLDLEGLDWESQYFRIQEFLSNYNVWKCGVDAGGVGDVVLDRLRNLMPHIDFVPMSDATTEQSKRWKYLKSLIDRKQISWPGGAKVRGLKTWRRFIQEMSDAQLEYKGPNLRVFAPNEANAHDDYVDSCAMAAILSEDTGEDQDDTVVVYENFFRESRYR